jgi:hypothetical protein
MRKLTAAIILIAGLVSCVGIDQNLGGEFIPTEMKYDFYTAEFDLDEVWMKSVDSLTAYSSRRITIGSIRDDTFGLFRRGSAVTLVPVLDSVDLGKNPVFQKFKFKAAVDSVSVADENQANILQNVNVYALTEPLSSNDYFLRAEVKHGDKRISKGVPVANGVDSLNFEFTEDFGKQYLSMTQDDLKDLETYTKKFPGIYLCTDDPEGNGGRFDMYEFDILRSVTTSGTTYLTRTDNYAILYYNSEFDGERRDTSLMFYFSPVEMQDLDSLITAKTLPSQYVFNVDSHESDRLVGKAEDKIYIEGGSGVKPMVPAKEIHELVNAEISRNGGDPATTLITKATIEFPFEFPDDYTTMFRYPKTLSPTIKVSTDTTVTFAGLTDASASDENQGDINRSLCNYAPDITHHVQQIIRKDADDSKLSNYDIWFLVMWYESNTTTNAEAEELANYYQQLAYYSYYSQLYGGYGYSSYSSYGSYYNSYYNNYYNYMQMAAYASASATTTTSDSELDKDRYYRAVLYGPKSKEKRPKLKVTYAIPKASTKQQ